MSLTDDLLNKITWKIPNALVIVGSRAGEEWNGMTTSWVTQLSMQPVLVGIGVDNVAVTHRLISEGGAFTINLWDAEDTKIFRKFSKPAQKEGMNLNGYPIRVGTTGTPIWEGAIAYMDCVVRHSWNAGTHTLFVGEIVDAEISDDQARPASMSDTRMKYGGVVRGGHSHPQ